MAHEFIFLPLIECAEWSGWSGGDADAMGLVVGNRWGDGAMDVVVGNEVVRGVKGLRTPRMVIWDSRVDGSVFFKLRGQGGDGKWFVTMGMWKVVGNSIFSLAESCV